MKSNACPRCASKRQDPSWHDLGGLFVASLRDDSPVFKALSLGDDSWHVWSCIYLRSALEWNCWSQIVEVHLQCACRRRKLVVSGQVLADDLGRSADGDLFSCGFSEAWKSFNVTLGLEGETPSGTSKCTALSFCNALVGKKGLGK